MKLSVIMPTFNQGKFIGQAIDSIINQPQDIDLELVIMDAASTDNTGEIVAKYKPLLASRGVELQYVSEPDRGQSDAINKGVKRSTGELLGCLCSDDYFEPDVLGRVIDYFKDKPEAEWGFGGWKFVDYDRQVFSVTQPKKYNYHQLQVLCNVGMPSCFYKKDFLIDVGMVDPDLHLSMDYDMWFRMSAKMPAIIMPFVVANMRYYGQTKSGTKTLAHLRESFTLQRKYSHGPITRVRQWWYYFRGLVMIATKRDVTTRVESRRQRRLRAAGQIDQPR